MPARSPAAVAASRSGIALNSSGMVSNQSGGGDHRQLRHHRLWLRRHDQQCGQHFRHLWSVAEWSRQPHQPGRRHYRRRAARGVLANAWRTVVNAGGIVGVGYGVQLAAGGTIIAQSGGTISSAGTAVSFGAARTNRLVVQPNAVFVRLGQWRQHTRRRVNQYAGAGLSGSTGTFSALGSQFINFAQVTVDVGARWTFSGTNSLAAHATLTNVGTVFNSGTTGMRLAGGYELNQAGGLVTNSAGAAVYGGGGNRQQAWSIWARSMVKVCRGTASGSPVAAASSMGRAPATSALITASSEGHPDLRRGRGRSPTPAESTRTAAIRPTLGFYLQAGGGAVTNRSAARSRRSMASRPGLLPLRC